MQKTLSEDDVKACMLFALGLPGREVAAIVGKAMNTIYTRQSRNRELWDSITEWLRPQVDRVIAERVKAIEDSADHKARIARKSYKLIEKSLDRGISEDVVDPSGGHLKAAEMGLDRTEGKPLDRKQVLEIHHRTTRHEVLHHIEATDLINAVQQMEKLAAMRSPAAALPAIDVEASQP